MSSLEMRLPKVGPAPATKAMFRFLKSKRRPCRNGLSRHFSFVLRREMTLFSSLEMTLFLVVTAYPNTFL